MNQGTRIMGDTKKPVDPLPGNHGQFGADVETENYETLPDLDVGSPAEAPAGEAAVPAPDDAAKTPGQHQEQGGMRS